MMQWLEHPLILILAGAIVPSILGIMAYRRGVIADRKAELSESRNTSIASVAQIIQGLESLGDSLQEDNKVLRENIRQCAIKLEQAMADKNALLEEIQRLNRQAGG